jgi:hypothetical protein
MPCRDYMDDVQESPVPDLKARLDMLSRIACKALDHIEQSGDGLEVLLLKDPEIADWWREWRKKDLLVSKPRLLPNFLQINGKH